MYPAVGVAGAAACEKRPVSSLTGAAVDAAILALTAFRGLGSFLTPRIGQADTIAVLEQPALADGERSGGLGAAVSIRFFSLSPSLM